MSDPTLYGFAPSTYTRTARMALAEKGVEYRLRAAPIDDPARHAALHPFRKMPVLQHDELRVFETLAIGTYIDEAFEGPPLQPTTTTHRVEMLQWISACNDVVDAELVRAYVETGDDAGEAELARARERLAPIDAWLEGRDWLAGDAISLADLFLAPMLAYALGHAGEKLIRGFPELRKWQATMQRRPSFTTTAPHSNH